MAQPNKTSSKSKGPPVRVQSSSGPPVRSIVRVAVLPPRLPHDMIAPVGFGPGEGPGFGEDLNYIHNHRINPSQAFSTSTQPPPFSPSQSQSPEITTSPSTKPFRKTFLGLRTTPLTAREKSHDTPPFTFREVTYEVWRKHYAKDSAGRYRGTDTPAEDCLLLPEDVQRWRLGDIETRADLWTRGRDALPGYASAAAAEDVDMALPEYSATLPDGEEAPCDSRVLSPVPSRLQRINTTGSISSTTGFVAGGRGAEQIIQEFRAKHDALKKEDPSWKKALKTASGYNLMGLGPSMSAEEAEKRRGGNRGVVGTRMIEDVTVDHSSFIDR